MPNNFFTAAGCTTQDVTIESIREIMQNLPPPDPRGHPRICVTNVERFRVDIKASKAENMSAYAGIPIYEADDIPESAVCRIEWWRSGDDEPNETTYIPR